MSEWIKCSDRLPEDYNYVISINNHRGSVSLRANWYNRDLMIWMTDKDPTHWMPLPPISENEDE